MQQYQNVLQDKFGNVIVGASVAVYVYGTTTPATIYSGNGTGLLPSNTVTTSSLGEFAFYAANGRYSLSITATNFALENYSDFILYDPADIGAVAASGVAFTPFSTIAATNVQNAIQEVVSDLSASSGSSLVGFLQSGTGAVTRTVQAKERDVVSVKDFDAKGDGTTDDTAAVAAAFAAASAGSILLFPAGTYKIASVNFSGKAITLFGYGASITCTSATGAVYKTDHGNKLQVNGISFTGTSTYRAINHQSAQSTTVYDELEIVDCTFNMGSGVYGIYSVGTREARILKCTFLNTSDGYGIYFKDSVSPFVDKCIFKGQGYTSRAIYYPGTGTAYDAGLVLRDSEIMGYDKGLEVVGCDWLVIEGCTIDYCNYSIKLGAQDGAQISNNYIGSLGANPALWITYDAAGTAPTYSDKIVVINNAFTGHYTGGSTYDCILVDGTVSPDNIQICHNSISFFTRYGIQFTMTSTRMCVHNNSFNQRTSFGVSPVYCSLGTSDANVSIKHNFFNNGATIAGLNVTFAQVNENLGFLTEGRGQVVVPSGNSTYNIPHGLSYTPATSDCQIVASNAEAANKNAYVSSVDATNLVVGFTTATAANAGVNWRIRRGA